MPDEIDRQIERDQLLLDAQIAVRKPVEHSNGRCFNCDEPLLPGVAYCDADCRADHEKEVRLRAHNPV
jgi:hypothetical protein